MEPLRVVRGAAVPLLLESLDTDVITPMRRILEGPEALVRYAFEPLRYRSDGSPDPDFPLNQPAYRGAPILLAGPNFACGSSRETAVWALQGLGFRCVIASGFGDIFFKNCFKNGLLPVLLKPGEVEALAAEARPVGGVPPELEVDLETQRITAPSGRQLPFAVNPLRREGLLAGLDELALTLRREQAIADFQREDRRRRPWIYQLPGTGPGGPAPGRGDG